MSGPVIIACVLLSCAPYFISDTTDAWVIGWSLKDLSIVLLSLCLFWQSSLSIQVRSAALVLAFFGAIDFAFQVIGLGMGSEYGRLAFYSVAAISAVYTLKQILIRSVSSDEYTAENYMYALFDTELNVLNSSKPLIIAVHGGCGVVAGDWIYCVNRWKFIKIPFSKINKDYLTLIDTGIQRNNDVDAHLDSFIGSKYRLFTNDCSRLNVGVGLNKAIMRRWGRSRG